MSQLPLSKESLQSIVGYKMINSYQHRGTTLGCQALSTGLVNILPFLCLVPVSQPDQSTSWFQQVENVLLSHVSIQSCTFLLTHEA